MKGMVWIVMKKTASLVSIFLFLSILLGICGVHSEPLGSLTIKYMRKDTGRGISGVELSLFRVGDISGGVYGLTPDFSGAAVDLNSLTNDNSKYNAAMTLYTYAVQHGIGGTVLYTDTNGNAYFPGLLPGVFVVAQTKEVSGFKTISPYIVFIPGQGVGGMPIYNILSNVKTEIDRGGSQGGGNSSFSITVAKIWDDSNDADAIRPKSVSVTLLSSGKKLTTISLSQENGWKHTFLNLKGNKASYTVEETPVDGYTASYSGSASDGFVIINSHSAVNPPKADDISVFVRKQWIDDNDNQGIRPKSVTIQLIKGKDVYRTAQLDGSNDWSFRFDNLPDAEYTVKEITPKGYTTSYNRTNGNLYTVINTLGNENTDPPLEPINPNYSSVSVQKVWMDNENADGLRPESITIRLLKDGKTYLSAELSDKNGWKHIFTELPKSSKYSVYEEADGKYSVSYSGNATEGYVVTNTYPTDNPQNLPPEPTSPGMTQISVEKIWLDNDNEEGKRPGGITVRLIKDGGVYRELELTSGTGWKGTFFDVPADASYTIIENEIPDYSATYSKNADNGFIITNTYVPGNSSIGIPPKPIVPELTDEDTSFGAGTSEIVAIPQTGNMNWPVPALAILGIIFLIIGFVLLPPKRSDNK